MKTHVLPIHFPEDSPEGPWGVNSIGNDWYVIRAGGRGARRIGRVIGFKSVSPRRPNYFERALEEAHRRNRGEST